MISRFVVSAACRTLQQEGREFIELFRHGSMTFEYYKPDKVDRQQPHVQDELYFVASGNGFFVNGQQRQAFEAGEVLFVRAGEIHRFEDFSDDFATWVIFYGPTGGEVKA